MLYFISFILLCHTVIIPVLHVEMLSVSITILLREGPLVSSGHELDQSLVLFLANGVFVCGLSQFVEDPPIKSCTPVVGAAFYGWKHLQECSQVRWCL